MEAFGHNYKPEKLRMLIRDLIGAGIDTTRDTISWTIVYLANHTKWQERLREQVSLVNITFQSKTS